MISRRPGVNFTPENILIQITSFYQSETKQKPFFSRLIFFFCPLFFLRVCHQERLFWAWEEGVRVHDSQSRVDPQKLSKDNVLSFIRKHSHQWESRDGVWSSSSPAEGAVFYRRRSVANGFSWGSSHILQPVSIVSVRYLHRIERISVLRDTGLRRTAHFLVTVHDCRTLPFLVVWRGFLPSSLTLVLFACKCFWNEAGVFYFYGLHSNLCVTLIMM